MIVLGIDESYQCTGMSVAENGKLLYVKSWSLRKYKNKTLKRARIQYVLRRYIEKFSPNIILVERIRVFSQGFMSKNYLTATGALIATIVDTAYEYDIPVYSVDTRSWKSKVVGTSKSDKKDGKKETKQKTMDFVKALGFDVDNDAADSACISLYYFCEGAKLKLET